VTILTTVEVEDTFAMMQFSRYAISFLTDDIIRLRYGHPTPRRTFRPD